MQRKKIPPIDPQQTYCSIQQAAHALGVADSTIRKTLKDGNIPGAKPVNPKIPGSKILIPVAWVRGE